MNSFQANLSVDHSEDLNDWQTNETNEIYCVNNPFDEMALKAENMYPFELVSLQTSSQVNPPCDNILSPLFKLIFFQRKRSMSLTDIDKVTNFLEQINQVKTPSDNKLSPDTSESLFNRGFVQTDFNSSKMGVSNNNTYLIFFLNCKFKYIKKK